MEPFKVYIGYDPRDDQAYKVCEASLRKHASVPVRVIKLADHELRQSGVYWRSYRVDRHGQMWDERDGKPFSTQFSFTRFAPPIIENYDEGWVLFMDADMMWRADIKELIDELDDQYAVMCVQHEHHPEEKVKMDGVLQTTYTRKNWSSLVAYNCWKNEGLTKFCLNNWSGTDLHNFKWLTDDGIGSLSHEWNFLDGYDNPDDYDPKIVHFTLGTPDMEHRPASRWDKEWWSYL